MLGWREKPGGRVGQGFGSPTKTEKPKSNLLISLWLTAPSHTKLREPFKMKDFHSILSLALFFVLFLLF